MGSIITRTACPSCACKAITKVLQCKDYTVSSELFDIMECADCTLRFTQGVPDEEGIAPYYQADSYISHTDSERGMINKLYKIARNYTLNWKTRLVAETVGTTKPSGSVLDIGAGTGAFLHAAMVAGWSVTGLEPDAGARQICLEKYNIAMEPPGQLFHLGDAKYDAVTMWHVLEHVHQLHEYISQVKRVLKPGGVALIALPNYTSADAAHYGSYWAAYDVPRHLYHFNPAAMNKLVEQHGLKVNTIKPMWLDAYYIALLSEGYQKGRSNMPAALWHGLRSNLHALNVKTACSSLVYVVRNGSDQRGNA